MNLSLIYNPSRLIERFALEIGRNRRLRKLKSTVAKDLKLGHIDSLELLENILNDNSELKKKAVIYDIGSNIGTWTLLAKALYPHAEIHAFEPLKIHTSVFNVNCSKLEKVHLHEFCVGNENSTSVINVSSYSDSSSLLQATQLEFEQYNIKKETEEPVEIKRLADLIQNKIMPVPDIIKLDIQGFELEALKGMGEWLKSVKYIICEVAFNEYYHGQPLFLDIANYLKENNFRIFSFGHNTPVGRPLAQIDVLFKNDR